jgi:hypothetical protein
MVPNKRMQRAVTRGYIIGAVVGLLGALIALLLHYR